MYQGIKVAISGRVQGVMFRDFTRRKASALGIVGTVKNKEDGTVLVVAEGEQDALDSFIELLKKGPLLSRVKNVDIEYLKPVCRFTSFSIVYD